MAPVAFECFIGYAPRAGLLCAVAYRVRRNDVCGWWTGRDMGAENCSAYFLIENYFTGHEDAFLATLDDDLRGGWRVDYTRKIPVLDKPLPLDDTLAHDLEQMQIAFTQEWLAYADDDHAAAEVNYYAQAELAMGTVAPKHRQLGRFDKTPPTWRYYSHGCDGNVLARLARNWPLSYQPPSDRD